MRTTAVPCILAAVVAAVAAMPVPLSAQCKTADVVALDQVFFYNRIGAVNPAGMIYALRRDVVPVSGTSLTPGNVRLRDGKRPRPLVLRINVGECLTINFTNLLAAAPVDAEQPATRSASAQVLGLSLADIASAASHAGQNASSLAGPGGSAVYTYHANREGTFLLSSGGAMTGGEGNGGSLSAGLFGAVNVEPAGAEYYRSQVTAAELQLATAQDQYGTPLTTPGGQPVLNYSAVYPPTWPEVSRRGLPVLRMTMGTEIVHSDLNAIVTGPAAGRFPTGTYRANPVYPDRLQPFREFTVIFHDEIMAVQAFPEFTGDLAFTLHSVRDGFAINYGAGGAGAEILANRKSLGPMKDCTECKYEEFFLTSWVVGDPAMIVDNPANSGLPATIAYFPDDPSNVHHSYVGDHVKFRNLHAGPKEHHIFHLHAHQWLHTPDSDTSSYLDSQAIGPGSGFTYEITHNGSGNRNKTVGDAIFHCHFYPHFAQGMWSLWRSHDVFEDGSAARNLPDPEIPGGTPTPAVVPVPAIAMAPMPTASMPGYPHYIPGIAGHRPPRPPLDIAYDSNGQPMDGGLPRHVITGGTAATTTTRLDMSKALLTASALSVPESGTAAEMAAMAYHGVRNHASYKPDGAAANFVTNGLPGVAGAPFADPCVTDTGLPTGTMRRYKAAAIQLSMTLNKAGWHYPQARMLSLWEDVAAFRAGTKPPEPLFFRANTGDCVEYQHTNLLPGSLEQDAFQVRTPTDILGQHIHLVKFDVTASDGSGNGFNYEDGTFAPDEVMERINAINAPGGTWNGVQGSLVPKAHPFFGTLGAMTTVQRWYVDGVVNGFGRDRTLRTVYTHDHYGPSTHQQTGLYAGLVIEPAGSSWRHSETGVMFGGRSDGGPTSWRADILTSPSSDSYREFLLEFADFQLAYDAANNPVNPPAKNRDPVFGLVPAAQCPGTAVAPPCPEAISAADPGTMTVNYRHEPIALRVRNPVTNTQAAGAAGDLANAFRSDVTRADAAFNTQPAFYPALTGGVQPGDPFTPLLRAYENDKVQIRIMVGAQEEGHNFSVHGVKWQFEPADANSGFRSSQMMGISEHYEFVLPPLPPKGTTPYVDMLYKPGSSTDDLWNGLWGIVREYNGGSGLQPDLLPLPNNLNGKAPPNANPSEFAGICPKAAPSHKFSIAAVRAVDALPGGTLVYNSRANQGGQLHDPTALLYVRDSDLDSTGRLKPNVPVEPLILRAPAGACVSITLTNRLPATLPDMPGWNTLPMIVQEFNSNQLVPSSRVGLHAQLLAEEVTDDGTNVGFNPADLAAPAGGIVKYTWYAGTVSVGSNGVRTATPVEFGAVNLMPTDPIKHAGKGLIGALIVEPAGSTWVEDPASRAQATVTKPDGTSFREFVLMFQNDINLRYADNTPVPNLAGEDDSEDSGGKAFNYRTEPLWKRMGYAPETPLETTRTFDYTGVLANSKVGGDPQTPVFTARAGVPVRIRVLHPGGHQRNNVFALHGHSWQELPYTGSSAVIGNNALSEVKGAQAGHGPTNHFDVVLSKAGGRNSLIGDFLYRDLASFQFDGGLWGIMRVVP